jgi:HEAT repeat protein
MQAISRALRRGVLTLGLLAGGMSGRAIGQDSSDVTSLIPQITAANPFARVAAIGKVAELGHQAAPTAPALLDALRCERMDVLFETPQVTGIRQTIAAVLGKLGPSIVPELQTCLQSENGLVRVGAATALYRIDPSRHRDQALRILIAALKADDETASDAAQALESVGADAAPALPELIRQLGHDDPAVRCQIGHALAALKGDATTTHLQNAIKNATPLQKVGIAFAIAKQTPESFPQVEKLLAEGLRDPSPEVRQQTVWAIGQLGPTSQPLARDLVHVLSTLNPDPREYFFGGGRLGRLSFDPSLALVAMGPDVKEALSEALDSEDPRTRLMAGLALVRIDPNAGPRVAPVFQQARQETNQALRWVAEMNAVPAAQSANQNIDTLIQELLQSTGFGPPSPAVGQLSRLGAEAVEPLMKVLETGDGQAAMKVTQVLAAIGKPAVAPLSKALHSELPRQRLYAVNALAMMGPANQELLIEALSDTAYPVRRAARYALKALNTPEAREALTKSADHR